MATEKPTTTAVEDTATVIAAAVAAGVKEALKGALPVQHVPFGKQKSVSPFDPSGVRKRELKRTTLVNGLELNPRVLFDGEMDLLDMVTKGSYLDGKVQVLIDDTGMADVVHIKYRNKTSDQRQDLMVPSFTVMLQRIVDEGKSKVAAVKAARSKEIRDAIEE